MLKNNNNLKMDFSSARYFSSCFLGLAIQDGANWDNESASLLLTLVFLNNYFRRCEKVQMIALCAGL